MEQTTETLSNLPAELASNLIILILTVIVIRVIWYLVTSRMRTKKAMSMTWGQRR